jgi:formylglycine-generating enzyme required for sulfatase activity
MIPNGKRNLSEARPSPRRTALRRAVACIVAGVAVCLLLPYAAAAQTIVVHRVDASDFPVLRAWFYAFDDEGRQIVDIQPDDLQVVEDDLPRSILRVESPPASVFTPVAAVLALPVAEFVDTTALEIFRRAAQWWAGAMPAPQSFTAVTTYSDTAVRVHDFSADTLSLRSAIAGIRPSDRWEYAAAVAFRGYPASGLEMCGTRDEKKVVVLFSGRSFGSGDDCDIPYQALDEGVQLNALVYRTFAHESLRRACETSLGTCYDSLRNVQECVDALRDILYSASAGGASMVEWQSDGCKQLQRELALTLQSRGCSTRHRFEVPAKYQPEIYFTPAITLQFRDVPPGGRTTQTLRITGRRRALQVSDIRVSNDRFRVTDYGGSAPPFALGENESRDLVIEFAPRDTTYQICRIEFETDGCFGKSFYADGLAPANSDFSVIAVERPNGGERLVAGNIERLTWTGVAADEPVRLEYSIDGGASWIRIAEGATGLAHDWTVPATPSDSCLLRATREHHPTLTQDMVYIPPGTFLMGNITDHPDYSKWSGQYGGIGYDTEKPVHEVSITRPFYMARTELTQEFYESVAGENPSTHGGPQNPVNNIGWYDAVRFCNLLSKQEGLDTCYSGEGKDIRCDFAANGYRLPTEAEWEYACRAGTRTDYYSGDLPVCARNTPLPHLDSVAWNALNTDPLNTYAYGRPVGRKRPNAFGLYDMHGNAWEYCWDCEDWFYYAKSPSLDPRGAGCYNLEPFTRVVRGGGAASILEECRSAMRWWVFPERNAGRTLFITIRLVRGL